VQRLPYTLEMLSLRRLSQRTFSMFSSAAPALSALAGLVVLGESLSAIQWLAIASMVGASVLTTLSEWARWRGRPTKNLPHSSCQAVRAWASMDADALASTSLGRFRALT
jgi:hypothetical protein